MIKLSRIYTRRVSMMFFWPCQSSNPVFRRERWRDCNGHLDAFVHKLRHELEDNGSDFTPSVSLQLLQGPELSAAS